MSNAFPSQQLTTADFRKMAFGFEEALKERDGAFVGDSPICPLKHSFSPGIYVREIFIPKGTMLTGKIHKHKHPNFLMSGKVMVITEGAGVEELEGPISIMSPPGTKRALKALTDLTWITVHHNPTDTEDLEEIEREVIAATYEDYDRLTLRQGQKNTSLFSRIINKLKGGL